MSTYTTLRRGSRGETVKKLQQSLLDKGYSVGSAGVDGSYGADTEAAVKQYQRAAGLSVDGVAGSQTLKSLSLASEPKSTPLLAKDALDAYLNREDFRFDLNGDALYQQYKNDYANQGKRAMADTVGQAAALTGGYGSSYAQSVGQQNYQAYLEKLGQIVPEVYQLAYDRYRQEGDELYRRYAVLAQQEEQAYQRQRDAVADAQWEREFAQSLAEYQQKYGEGSKDSDGLGYYSDYITALRDKQGEGMMLDENGQRLYYDNGQVSTGNIMTLQRILGIKADGLWTEDATAASGGMTADMAWAAYQRGSLPYRHTTTTDSPKVSQGNIRMLERILGTKEDGIWSAEDKKAAGGMTSRQAWAAYQKGSFQYR